MKFFLPAFLLPFCLAAQPPLFHQSGFAPADAASGSPWKLWAPRPEIAPRGYFEDSGWGALALSGDSNPAVFGGWERIVQSIEPEHWYAFQARYRAQGLDYAPRQVVARLDWLDSAGKRAGQPDYPWQTSPDREAAIITHTVQAPPRAAAVKIQLLLVNAPTATLLWDEVSLAPAAAPPARKVKVASVNLKPRNSTDPVGEFLALMERSLPEATDIVVLPEGIAAIGTGKSYADTAEPIPGPSTARLGAFARVRKTWLVAGLYEKERQVVYNTAVLIDRQGRLAGRYRKMYIPREEFEGGITPGSSWPVFRTDFGTVGLMICWDVQYPDPARALALRGAELLLMPIAGGNETLARARAIENHVFLAASGYDHPTYVMDPDGETLSKAERGSIAAATIDLSRRYLDSWLGDMRDRFWKEVRVDTPVDPPGRR